MRHLAVVGLTLALLATSGCQTGEPGPSTDSTQPVVPALAPIDTDDTTRTGAVTEDAAETTTDDDAEDGANGPVVHLPINGYEAGLGQTVRFDASGSEAVDAEIVLFEWDFDGDGDVDLSTAEPVVEHLYGDPFDGHMIVRATDSAGRTGSLSVTVRIGQEPDLGPDPPEVTAVPTGNSGEIRVSWVSPGIDRWLVALDDFTFGFTYDNPITIADLEPGVEHRVTITPIGPDDRIGQPATVAITLDDG